MTKNPYFDVIKSDLSDNEALDNSSQGTYEQPRMVKKRDGHSLKKISAAAIMGETD